MNQNGLIDQYFPEIYRANARDFLADCFVFSQNDKSYSFEKAIVLSQLGEIVNPQFKFEQIAGMNKVLDAFEIQYRRKLNAKMVIDIFYDYRISKNNIYQTREMVDCFTNMTDAQIKLASCTTADQFIRILQENYYGNTQICEEVVIKLLLRRKKLDILLDPKLSAYVQLKGYFYQDKTYDFSLVQNYLLNGQSFEQQVDSIVKILQFYPLQQRYEVLSALVPETDTSPADNTLIQSVFDKIYYHISAQKLQFVVPKYPPGQSPSFLDIAFLISSSFAQVEELITNPLLLAQQYKTPFQTKIIKLAVINQEQLNPFTQFITQNTFLASKFSTLRLKTAEKDSFEHVVNTLNEQTAEEMTFVSEINVQKLIFALPIVNCPIMCCEKIDQMCDNIQLLLELGTEPPNNQIKALQGQFQKLLIEMQMRMNKQNAEQFKMQLLQYQYKFPQILANFIFDSVQQTDLSSIYFDMLLSAHPLIQKMFIVKALKFLEISLENEVHKKGHLSKLLKPLACFSLNLIFQTQPLYYFKYISVICLKYLKQGSYLFLFFFREFLSNLFSIASQQIKSRRKETDSQQLSLDAFQSYGHLKHEYMKAFFEYLKEDKIIYEYISIMRVNCFQKLILLENINFEEISDLITQTRNDFLFFLDQQEFDQEFIQKQFEIIQINRQNANIVLFEAIMMNKQINQQQQNKENGLSYILCNQNIHPIPKDVLQYYTSFFSQEDNTVNPFYLFITAPQFFHESIVIFLTRFKDQLIKVLYNFIQFGYVSALSFTKQDTDRFALIIQSILKAVDEQTRIQLLLYHYYLIIQTFQITYSQQLMELHYVIQMNQFQGECKTIIQFTSKCLCDVTKSLDQDTTSVLIRTVALNLKQALTNIDVAELNFQINEIIDSTDELSVLFGFVSIDDLRESIINFV
ncbi:Conserved_hypothetical protein [Hexamita inflata]|uniref:Uncharacterized protein n=1 Tax=Hexamita inflata TaxID=28002 RepID=A0AA86QTU5_9EUKA|nr:Conserved hypothetical protein [Hexamita inflata]